MLILGEILRWRRHVVYMPNIRANKQMPKLAEYGPHLLLRRHAVQLDATSECERISARIAYNTYFCSTLMRIFHFLVSLKVFLHRCHRRRLSDFDCYTPKISKSKTSLISTMTF